MPSNRISIELIARAGRLLRELDRGSAGVRKFGGAVKNEFRALGGAANSLQGKLAGIGVSFGAAAVTRQAALLDKANKDGIVVVVDPSEPTRFRFRCPADVVNGLHQVYGVIDMIL